jgi:hypothetical protein
MQTSTVYSDQLIPENKMKHSLVIATIIVCY